MSRLSRDLLVRAFGDNPLLRAQFEELDQFIEAAEQTITNLLTSANEAANRLATIEAADKQAHSTLLDAVARLPDEPGAVEFVGVDDAVIRGIDSDDDACLISRGQAISFAGKGATADRPVLSALRRAIYFDTTLAPNGKPVFWTGSVWVDSGGAAV